MNIRKTNCSHHRCCIPGCRTSTNNLSRIPIEIRFKAMKTRKNFIPRGATACSMHQSIVNWDINVLMHWNKFSPDKIKEMVDLLCDVKQSNTEVEAPPGTKN